MNRGDVSLVAPDLTVRISGLGELRLRPRRFGDGDHGWSQTARWHGPAAAAPGSAEDRPVLAAGPARRRRNGRSVPGPVTRGPAGCGGGGAARPRRASPNPAQARP